MEQLLKDVELIKVALDKATKEGVFNLTEVGQIIPAIINIESSLKDNLESAETQLKNGQD